MSGDTLESWKAIADYLHRDVRTVMRWEQVRWLPVHRVPGGGKPGVYAFKSELDTWRKSEGSFNGRRTPVPATRHVPSVAVLPFVNLSADKANEYFGDGLADEVITVLTRIQGLRVTARTSSFAFRDSFQDVRVIGRMLGVNALLEGSVQRTGHRIRVSAQLVDAVSGFHLWSDQYDGDYSDVFLVQDQIARAIARALELRLEPPRVSPRSPNLEAYNLWVKARSYQHYADLDALVKCRSCLEQAIATDPQFARPYVSLAELIRQTAAAGTIRPRDAIAEGRAALAKALALDSSHGEALALSGTYRVWAEFDWSGAAADFDRAMALAPASAQVHLLRSAYYLVPVGRLREAEWEMEQALESDPVSPLAYIELGKVLLWARQFERAQARLEAAFALRPDYPLAEWYHGVGLYFRGRVEEALAVWKQALRKIGPCPPMMGAVGMACGNLGLFREARAVLDDLADLGRAGYASPVARAQVYLGLGETAAMFEWLDRAIDERDPLVLDLPCKPIWDGVRGDQRFRALLSKLRLC